MYLNGNYVVHWRGHVQEKRALRVGEELISEFPDSIDLKITNKCPWACPYCHESSIPNGKSFDLEKTKAILSQLPEVPIEIAIGGGDVLDAPKVSELIKWLNDRGNKTRATINIKDILKRRDELKRISEVEAIGISMDNLDINLKSDILGNPSLAVTLWNTDENDSGIFHEHPFDGCVIHIIAGVFPYNKLEELFNISPYPILILGYKHFGRSKDFEFPTWSVNKFRDTLLSIIDKIKNRDYSRYIGSRTVGFDNLAMEQLGIKDVIPDREWDRIYMGDEGTHSMYVDAVKGEFAMTSRSENRVSWDSVGLIDYFKSLKKQ